MMPETLPMVLAGWEIVKQHMDAGYNEAEPRLDSWYSRYDRWEVHGSNIVETPYRNLQLRELDETKTVEGSNMVHLAYW